MKFCPNCGAQLQDDATFCSGCGANLDPNAAQQQAPNYGYQQAPNYGYQAPPQQPAPKKKGGFLKKLISLVLTIAIILTAVAIFLPGPEAVAKRAVKALIKGDADKAAKYFVKADADDLDYYADALKEYDKVKIKGTEVENVDKDELEGLNLLLKLAGEKEVKAAKIVTVKVEVTYEGETVTEELPLVVVKQGLQWKILSFD